MYNISISDEAADVQIVMNTHLSIVHGNSGIGKTLLCSVIRRIQERNLQPDAQKIFIVDNHQLFELIPHTSCDLIVIDKCEQYLEEDELVTMMRNYKSNYLVFARSGMNIPSTIFDVSELKVQQEGRHLTFNIFNSLGRPE